MEANTLRDGELLPERELKQRSELVPKMKFTDCDVSAMIAESREACKRLRKLGMLRKTCYPSPQRAEASPRSRKSRNQEEKLWVPSM